MKYLPQNLKMQGLAGQGLSSQAYLNAMNNYNNTLANIDSNYNSNKRALQNDFNNQSTENDRWWENYNYQKESDQYTKDTNLSNDVWSVISSTIDGLETDENGHYKAEDLNKLRAYFDANKNNIQNEGMRNSLSSYLDLLEKSNNLIRNDDGTYSETTHNEDGSITTITRDNEGNLVDTNVKQSEVLDPELRQTLKDKYNISFDSFNNRISNSSATEQFGNNTTTSYIIRQARAGKVSNGSIVNMNYGGNQNKNYLYYDGYWYKVEGNDQKANLTSEYIKSLPLPKPTDDPGHRGGR